MKVLYYDSLLIHKIHSFCTIHKFDISQIACLKQLESLESEGWKLDISPIYIYIIVVVIAMKLKNALKVKISLNDEMM